MAKRSQRFPVNYEKDQSGCMWGFISIFDFRHGRFTRKLIADKRLGSKHVGGAALTKNKFEVLSNLDEEYQANFDRGESKRLMLKTDADKLSVKKLIEEEMIIEQDEINDQGNAEVESKPSRLGHEDPPKKDSKRKKKSRKKSRDMDSHDLNSDATLKSEFSHNQHSRQQSKDNLDLDKIMDDFFHVEAACSMMHDNDGKIDAQSNQNHVISENLANAIHEFVNQMILNGKDLPEDGQFLSSHELMEALQVISSDKQLFLRLLQDPNSHLLKYIQELENVQGRGGKDCSSVTGSNCSEQELVNLKQTREIANRKHRSFFKKRVKSQSKDPTNENGKTEFSNRIVILKPALTGMQISESGNSLASSLDSHDITHYKGSSVRVGSHFSLTEIKRKLKHAMGKERHGSPEVISRKLPVDRQNKVPRGKSIGKDNPGMRSPNKDHFFIEKIARPMFDVVKGNKTGTLKNSELNVEHESGTPIERVSNIYIEAKKHLCEMLDNADENTNISSRQIPKTLGRILSLPEYNFSPLESPGRDLEHHFVTAQARFSSSDQTREINEDNLSPKPATFIGLPDQETNISEKQSSICDESSNNKVQEIKSASTFSHDVDTSEACCPDEIVTEGNVESIEEKNDLESSLDPNGFITGKDQNIDISEIPDGARCSECLNQDIREENQPSSLPSSPHSSITKKSEELESGTDASGRPSPVSVLDTSFSDDDFGPRHSRCQPVKLPVQPLQIQFEEHDSSPAEQFGRGKYCCLEENELIYDYIKAALHASGLTSDQLLMKCLSSDKILDPSLFDQLEFFSNLLCHDQKLLFDSINEVLMEVCQHYFGVSPWISFVNPSMRPTPNMKKVILKVWEGVCWHVLPLPPPCTLEQIVRKDMARRGTWMDVELDAETIGFEIGEAILAELMEDTILSLVCISPETKCSLLQFALKDNESSFHL